MADSPAHTHAGEAVVVLSFPFSSAAIAPTHLKSGRRRDSRSGISFSKFIAPKHISRRIFPLLSCRFLYLTQKSLARSFVPPPRKSFPSIQLPRFDSTPSCLERTNDCLCVSTYRIFLQTLLLILLRLDHRHQTTCVNT